MIEGFVRDRVAGVERRMRSPADRTDESVTALIDTGFDGRLTLPTETIRRLRLDWIGVDSWSMADGRTLDFDLYAAEVFWDGRWIATPVLDTGEYALLGTRLLDGFRLTIDVTDGGRVTIARLTADSEEE